MRFFKTFSLLHRRTKSDTALPSTPFLLASPKDPPPSDTGGPPIRASVSLNLRMFEIDLENRYLTRVNASLGSELSFLKTQLQLTKSELYVEVHKNVHLKRQARRNKDLIADLQKASRQFSGFLDAFPTVASAFSNFEHNSREDSRMQITGRSFSVGRLIGRQTDDQHYSTALQLVLKTRQELRCCKKIALFWKQRAKTNPEHADLVTPSPSEISEVQDTLPKERVEAVNALQRRRQLTMNNLSGAQTSAKLQSQTERVDSDERALQSNRAPSLDLVQADSTRERELASVMEMVEAR